MNHTNSILIRGILYAFIPSIAALLVIAFAIGELVGLFRAIGYWREACGVGVQILAGGW